MTLVEPGYCRKRMQGSSSHPSAEQLQSKPDFVE